MWRSGSEWELGSSAGFLLCLVLCVDVPPPPPPGKHCKHKNQNEQTPMGQRGAFRTQLAMQAKVDKLLLYEWCTIVHQVSRNDSLFRRRIEEILNEFLCTYYDMVHDQVYVLISRYIMNT